MLEGHADRFIESIANQKKNTTLIAPKKAPKKAVPKPVSKKVVEVLSEGFPEYVTSTAEVKAATRSHSTNQGCSTLLDKKHSSGGRKYIYAVMC